MSKKSKPDRSGLATVRLAHEAFGHLAKRYGLRQVVAGQSALSQEVACIPQHAVRLLDHAADDGQVGPALQAGL